MNIFKTSYFKMLSIVLILILFTGCKEDEMEPINKEDATPDVIRNPEVESLAGAVKISYTLPSSEGILYVEAETKIHGDKVTNVRSSYYNNSIFIEGFGDTDEYEVKLYTVSRSLNRSEPVTLQVTPLDPPIFSIFNSLQLKEDFGGLSIQFANRDKANVSINVMVKDEIDEWVPTETFYTSQSGGLFTVRGFEPSNREFGVFIKDRWDNKTEMYRQEITPLYEERLDPDRFKPYFTSLDTEAKAFSGSKMSNLWSGGFVGTTSSDGWFRTDNGSGIPHHFTFDLGVEVKLSRYVLWQRGAFDRESLLYTGGSPRVWEVWGSNSPDPNGSYTGWTLMKKSTLTKPSGLAGDGLSNEDISVAQEGHEFDMPLEAPPVRYIRIKILETWGKNDYMWLSELQFYGQLN